MGIGKAGGIAASEVRGKSLLTMSLPIGNEALILGVLGILEYSTDYFAKEPHCMMRFLSCLEHY